MKNFVTELAGVVGLIIGGIGVTVMGVGIAVDVIAEAKAAKEANDTEMLEDDVIDDNE